MKYYKVEVDEKVYNYLKNHAEPFEDTPNSVLNRILFNKYKKPEIAHHLSRGAKHQTLNLPGGIPKALEQILEVIFEIKKNGQTRTEATNIVANKRRTAPQTVIDKYCRQLNKKAYEVDELLNKHDLIDFRMLLEDKFIHHKDVIKSFFISILEDKMLQNVINPIDLQQMEQEAIEDFHPIITCYKNKATGKLFIYLEDYNETNALFVTPDGKIKPLEVSLFEEMEGGDHKDLKSRELIREIQIEAYNEFVKNTSFDGPDDLKNISSVPSPDMKITQDDLIPHIIEIIEKHGGKARKDIVDEEIYQKFENVFDQPWYQQIVSNEVPRWKHFIAWAKERAKHRGLIKYPKESGVGYWELT